MSGQGQIPPVVLPPERYSQSSELACFNVLVPCNLGGGGESLLARNLDNLEDCWSFLYQRSNTNEARRGFHA